MIKSLHILGLHGKQDFYFEFNDDINLLTGKNGVGKTTILKVLWYVMSGNINQLASEIYFEKIEVKTNESFVKIERGYDRVTKEYFLDYNKNGKNLSRLTSHENIFLTTWNIDFALNEKAQSVFFPTFRRIEGGYGIDKQRQHISGKDVARTLFEFSRELSTRNHKFVSAVASRDVNSLIKHQEFSVQDQIEGLQNSTNSAALEKIKAANTDSEKMNALIEVTTLLEQVDKITHYTRRPFNILKEIIKEVTGHKNILFGDSVFLSDNVEDSISSNLLSSGEKQLISFLAYNAFLFEGCYFIDEPEISLHVDWQRKLIHLLCEQNDTNQFFIATHSPFIYGLYGDKEILISTDKGE